MEPYEIGLGLRGLMYGEEGFRSFFTSFPVNEIADLSGHKIRVSTDPVLTGVVNALGASPTNVSMTELYSALQTGIVDGGEQPISNYLANAFNEPAPYLILDQHTIGSIEITILDSSWEKLTADQQAALTQAAELTKQYNKETLESNESSVAQRLLDKGATIVAVADKTPWQEATKDILAQYIVGQEDVYEQIQNMK
jgi:TRAP-type C4-dicarboxylate transport system substrate-binding protein